MSRSTSSRSPFWLTERLGRTSQPTRRVGRGEIETVKHPSPSTYPEMYDGRCVEQSHRGPAYCSVHRFATTRSYDRDVTASGASPFRVQSLRGHTSERARGLPTALPADHLLAG